MTGNNLPKSLELELNNKKYIFNTSSEESRKKTYNALHPLIKYSKVDIRNRVIDDILSWANLPKRERNTHRIMTGEEIKQMSRSDSAIVGAHSHTYSPLSIYSYEEQCSDVKKSKDLLEQWTGQEIRYFSYPFGGKRDYNKNTLKICKELDFDIAFANFYGQVHSWTDKYQISRCL